jgi:hypothetical protein
LYLPFLKLGPLAVFAQSLEFGRFVLLALNLFLELLQFFGSFLDTMVLSIRCRCTSASWSQFFTWRSRCAS